MECVSAHPCIHCSRRTSDKVGHGPPVKDESLDSREARQELKARGKPYWRLIGRVSHRSPQGPTAGCGRPWIQGNQQNTVEPLAIAEDREDEDARPF